jgi:hypothetical protein
MCGPFPTGLIRGAPIGIVWKQQCGLQPFGEAAEGAASLTRTFSERKVRQAGLSAAQKYTTRNKSAGNFDSIRDRGGEESV